MDDTRLTHSEPFRLLSRRARIVTILLVLGIGASIAVVVSASMERSLLLDIQQGELVTQSQADANDLRQGLVTILNGLIFTLTTVFFLLWFYRAYRNVPALGGTTRYGVGWAVGGWFVPILALWRPKQIVNDIWRGSTPRPPGEQIALPDPVPSLFLVWWLAWIALGDLEFASTRASIGSSTVDEMITADWLAIVAAAVSIATAVLAVLFVQRTTDREEESAEMLGLVPEDESGPFYRRRSFWIASAAIVAAFAAQIGIAVAAWAVLPEEATTGSAIGSPATATAAQGTFFADDFSEPGGWVIRHDSSHVFEYKDGMYRMFLAEPGLRTSLRFLADDVASLSLQADATLADGDVHSDLYGIGCLTETRGSYLFGVAPDGYYTLAFDAGGDRKLALRQLLEDQSRGAFGKPDETNRLRADCAVDGNVMRLRLTVNGTVLFETTHEDVDRVAGIELFAYSAKGGTEVRFDNLTARPSVE